MIRVAALFAVLPVLITVTPEGIPRVLAMALCTGALGLAAWLVVALLLPDRRPEFVLRLGFVAAWSLLVWLVRRWMGV